MAGEERGRMMRICCRSFGGEGGREGEGMEGWVAMGFMSICVVCVVVGEGASLWKRNDCIYWVDDMVYAYWAGGGVYIDYARESLATYYCEACVWSFKGIKRG